VAPASAQTAAEKLDINTAPKDQLKTLPASGTPVRRKSSTGARIAPSWICCAKTSFPEQLSTKSEEKIIAKQPKASQ
jgi:hypothetical protein